MSRLILYPILALSISLSAQPSNKKIEVEINEHNQLYFEHELQKSETLYSLSQYYDVDVKDVLLINGITASDNIPEGTLITFPFNLEGLITSPKRQDDSWARVTYKARPRETLYGIASKYFPQKIENLFARNRIRSFTLKRGQELVVGWWSGKKIKATTKNPLLAKLRDNKSEPKNKQDEIPKDAGNETQPVTNSSNDDVKQKNDNPIPPEKRAEEVIAVETGAENNNSPESKGDLEKQKRTLENLIAELQRKKEELESRSTEEHTNNEYPDVTEETIQDSIYTEEENIEEVIPKVLSYENGLAYWDKEEFDKTNLYVMHNSAEPGSYIKLKYELTGREVTAKVVYSIPKSLYPDEIDIVISPGVAVALGALDSPFQIEMHYYE